jgi:hypothetical protein
VDSGDILAAMLEKTIPRVGSFRKMESSTGRVELHSTAYRRLEYMGDDSEFDEGDEGAPKRSALDLSRRI